MPGAVTVTNQQPPAQLGLGFPAPPGDTQAEYRSIKERRLFGRSRGYRDLTLAAAEADNKPVERTRSLRKTSGTMSSPSGRTTTLYAFGGDNSSIEQLSQDEARLSPPKLSRTGSITQSLHSRGPSSISIRQNREHSTPTPNLSEFGHKASLSTSFRSPIKTDSPHKRTATSSSLTVGPQSAMDKSGKFAVPTTPSSRRKTSVEKLPLSPAAARSKLSISKDGTHTRRTSFIPGATGLGARTISPTDASRLARRLSQPPQSHAHTIIVSEDEPLPSLTASNFEKKFTTSTSITKLPTLKPRTTGSRTPSPSPTSNRDSMTDSGIGSSTSGTSSSGHPSPNTVYLETNKTSRRKSLVVTVGQNGVPPVPPIPKELSDKTISSKTTSAKSSPKSKTSSPRGSPKPSPRYKSPPPPLPSSVPKTPSVTNATPVKSRERGITLSSSIPSYINAKISQTPKETSRTTVVGRSSLEPVNLPPIKVAALATPTVQRVNALVAKNSSVSSMEAGSSNTSQRTVTTPQTAVATRFPRSQRTPATPSLTPPIIHPSGVKTASAASSRRSIPSPGSLLIASRKNTFMEKHVSNSSLQGSVSKLPAHEEVNESPKSNVWRTVSRGAGKIVRRGSVNDRKIGVSPRKTKEEKEKEDAAAMPAPASIPRRNMFGIKKTSTPAKDSNTGSPMARQSSSSTTATPPPPRYSSASNPSTDDETLGGNSREMELIIRSAHSKYRSKIERDLEELEAVRRRVIDLGDSGIKDPVTPTTASKIWGRSMSSFEKGEIMDFPNIWYCSDSSVSKVGRGDPVAPSASKLPENATAIGVANFGFDDDIGNYVIVQGDHIAYRYEILGMLGKGSFGQVCKCLDHKTGKVVAVKIIRNKQRFHTQALVEVNILQKLCQWDADDEYHLIRVTHHFYFRGHLCIATELLGMNLYELIKTNEFRGFPLSLIRKFARQMLRCLLFLRKNHVVHCDMKPENILLVHPLKSDIKIIDFGSSCFENEKGSPHREACLIAVYSYIQSRFYRSPEVILGANYGMAIDMWSVGCILAELYTGYPLFPGENEQEQLACIMEIFGPPEKYLVEKSPRKKLFFDTNGKPKPFVSSKGKRRRPSTKTLGQALNCGDEPFVDFIKKCMRWSPDARMTPEEGLQHPFIGDAIPRVHDRQGSTQGKSMLPTPATYNGRTKSMVETTVDRRKRSQTGATDSSTMGGMSFSTSLPSFAQSQSSVPRPLPEVPKHTSSMSSKASHRLSSSISSRASAAQNYGTTTAEPAKTGLGIFSGPRRSTINSNTGSLSMKSSRENTSLLASRV